eukprot:1983441-Rhodomonas_salina.1
MPEHVLRLGGRVGMLKQWNSESKLEMRVHLWARTRKGMWNARARLGVGRSDSVDRALLGGLLDFKGLEQEAQGVVMLRRASQPTDADVNNRSSLCAVPLHHQHLRR